MLWLMSWTMKLKGDLHIKRSKRTGDKGQSLAFPLLGSLPTSTIASTATLSRKQLIRSLHPGKKKLRNEIKIMSEEEIHTEKM